MNQLSKFPHLSRYVSNLKTIPSGSYHWGASPTKQLPGTVVSVAPFRIGATPVTWGIWKEYCLCNTVPGTAIELPIDPSGEYLDNHPVVNVSWEDIMSPGGFCDWASSVAGFKLSVPTDVEWEFAARGGYDCLDYPWGNYYDSAQLWNAKEYGGVAVTAAVDRSHKIFRNEYGLTDMIGNIAEWCFNDKGLSAGWRGGRGCSPFVADPDSFLCKSWFLIVPDFTSDMFGFRLSAGTQETPSLWSRIFGGS
jgi:sulfatase modifying factor 1